MFGFAVLVGPLNHLKHLISRERLPFSFAYITSLALTLYFSIGVRNFALPVSPVSNKITGPFIHRITRVCNHPDGQSTDICICLLPRWSYHPEVRLQYCIPRRGITASKIICLGLCYIYCFDLIALYTSLAGTTLEDYRRRHACHLRTPI